MTERLYYTDSYLKEFTARVEGVSEDNDNWQVVLDKTAFYPTAGGQLFDTGQLSGESVFDCIDNGNEIVHVLKSKPAFQIGDEIEGQIDWERRRNRASGR